MYLRWDRSYAREFVHFMRIVWKRRPLSMAVSAADVIITNIRFPIGWASLGFLIVFSIRDPISMPRFFCMMAVFSTLNTVRYWHTERSWLFPYGVLYSFFAFFTLLWLFPYALCTLRTRT
jgi:hyaluronan synthase